MKTKFFLGRAKLMKVTTEVPAVLFLNIDGHIEKEPPEEGKFILVKWAPGGETRILFRCMAGSVTDEVLGDAVEHELGEIKQENIITKGRLYISGVDGCLGTLTGLSHCFINFSGVIQMLQDELPGRRFEVGRKN